jgi:hypothetical protein
VRGSYAVGETTVGIRTTSPAFGAWLDGALGPFRAGDEGDSEYSVVVDDDPAGRGRRFHVLYQGVGVVARALDVRVVARSLLRELEARVLHERRDGVYVHHGLVRSGSAAALVPAWLVSYLSGTGRRLSKAGITLPVSRWVRIDPATLDVTPAPRMLAVPDATLRRIPSNDAPTRDDAYDEPSEPVRIDAVVTYVPEMDTIASGSRARALYHLAEATANLRILGPDALAVLSQVVERAHCFDTGLGRPHQMLAALRAVFEHERSHTLAGEGAR